MEGDHNHFTELFSTSGPIRRDRNPALEDYQLRPTWGSETGNALVKAPRRACLEGWRPTLGLHTTKLFAPHPLPNPVHKANNRRKEGVCSELPSPGKIDPHRAPRAVNQRVADSFRLRPLRFTAGDEGGRELGRVDGVSFLFSSPFFTLPAFVKSHHLS